MFVPFITKILNKCRKERITNKFVMVTFFTKIILYQTSFGIIILMQWSIEMFALLIPKHEVFYFILSIDIYDWIL